MDSIRVFKGSWAYEEKDKALARLIRAEEWLEHVEENADDVHDFLIPIAEDRMNHAQDYFDAWKKICSEVLWEETYIHEEDLVKATISVYRDAGYTSPHGVGFRSWEKVAEHLFMHVKCIDILGVKYYILPEIPNVDA